MLLEGFDLFPLQFSDYFSDGSSIVCASLQPPRPLEGLVAWRLRGQGIMERQEAILRRENMLFLFLTCFGSLVIEFQLEASTSMHTSVLSTIKL